MKPERIALMPHWPARMDADMSALFLGISRTKFLEDVERGVKPRPIEDGKRKLWATRQLARFVDAEFGLPVDDPAGGGASAGSWDDL